MLLKNGLIKTSAIVPVAAIVGPRRWPITYDPAVVFTCGTPRPDESNATNPPDVTESLKYNFATPAIATGIDAVVSRTVSVVIPMTGVVAAAGYATVFAVPETGATARYAESVVDTFKEIGAIWLMINSFPYFWFSFMTALRAVAYEHLFSMA